MQTTSISSVESSMQKANEWFDRMQSLGHFTDQEQAYSALRAALHTIRDRVQPDQVAHLASHMPMLIRGIYYEGWRPALAPNDEQTPDEFRASVRESLATNDTIDVNQAIVATFQLLDEMVDPGEVVHLKSQLPKAVLDEFWSD